MNNNLSKVKQKINKKQLAVGTHVVLSEPIISEILCSCGFDIIWLDWEHGAMDRKDINLHIMAVLSKGGAPFVRVPWNDPVLIKPILEMGPASIIVPFIKTVEDAKLAVASCKYPPRGIRGFGPCRCMDYGGMSVEDYLEKSKDEPWVILQIEHIEAVNNLKEIIKIEGIDTIVVGPNDLAASVGLLGKTRHKDVTKLMDRIAEICNEANFPFGISMGANMEDIVDWLNRKASWIVLEKDVSFLYQGGKNILNLIKDLSH